MEIRAIVDLDEIWAEGTGWESTVSQLVIDEMKIVIKAEIKKAIMNDSRLKKAIQKVKDLAVKKMIEAL